MIEVRFTPERSEVVGAVRSQLLRRRSLLALSVVLLAWLVFAIVESDTSLAVGLVVGCATFLAIYAGWLPVRTWRRYAAVASGEVVYRIGEDGVDVQTQSTSSSSDWSAFAGTTRTRDLYVLETKGGMRLIIPRRAFAAPADEQAFAELVGRKLGGVAA